MFDRFKKLFNAEGEADAPTVSAPTAADKQVRRRTAGPDKVNLSGASSVAIPMGEAAPGASPAPGAGYAPARPSSMTFGLRDLLRAKPLQHFVILGDAIQTNERYRYHDIGSRYYEVYKPSFPAMDRFTSLTFWGFNFQGEHTAQIRILDVDENVIAELAGPYQFSLSRPSDTHETRTSWEVLFPKPGTYHLVVETDGRPTAVAPIFVTRETY